MQKRINRLASTRKRMLLAATALVAAFAAMSAVSPALASAESQFTKFKECPLKNTELEFCFHGTTESGYFTIGSRTVKIKYPQVLQGGIVEPKPNVQEFVGAANESETLPKTAQPVPGGLLNIVAPEFLNKEQKEKFEEAINKGPTGVNAIIELAAPASDIYISEASLEFPEFGPGLVLPVKVRLENAAFLGSKCYIGSNSAPIEIELTTGTSGSLTGAFGTAFFSEEGEILNIVGNKLVNQTFEAPGANGCGLVGGIVEKVVDEAVNGELGLPAGSGKNSAVLEGTILQAGASAVRRYNEK
jgi:hypothetical protein